MKSTLALTPNIQPQHRLKPAMLESLNILHMSSDALAAYLNEQMLSNPLLEWSDQRTARSDDLYEQAGQFVAAEVSLKQQLRQQAAVLLDPADQVIAETLIGLLDDDGYLREELDALCGLMHINKARLNRILSQLKSLKPAGIFAHDLRECLLLQLMEQHPENELARRLTEHLEALARGGTTSLCRTLHCTADQLNEAIALLRRCDPKPGRSQGAAAAPLVCEVQVEIEDGQFKITLAHSFSELIFNPMPINDPTVQDYLKQKTAEAKNLLLAIQKRNQTLASITRAICLNQSAFFLRGQPLIPLTRHQIADQLGLHPSTISRSLAGKGLEFNGQLYPFSVFFSAQVRNDLSQDQVLRQLKRLIHEEDAEAPLSDQQLSDRLKALGCPISRRTVVKYREKLRIPDSRVRRQWARTALCRTPSGKIEK